MNPNSLGINNHNGNGNILSSILQLQQQLQSHRNIHPQLIYGCTECGLLFNMLGNGINPQSILSPPATPNINNMQSMYNIPNIIPNMAALMPQPPNISFVFIHARYI